MSPHRPPEIYHSTPVTQNLEHVDIIAGQRTLSFYHLSQISSIAACLGLSRTTSKSAKTCSAVLVWPARIRLQHRKLRLSAGIEAIGFQVILVLVHQRIVAPRN